MADEREPQTPPKGGEGADKKRQRRMAYLIAGIGAVGVLIAWMSYRKGSGGGAAPASSAQPSAGSYSYPTPTSGGGYVPYSSADGSNASYQQAILQALAGLQSSMQTPTGSAPSGTSAAAPTPASTPDWQLIGSGYFLGGSNTTPESYGGANYFHIPSPADLQAYGAGHGISYFQPMPGVFQPVGDWGALGPGTPIYGKA